MNSVVVFFVFFPSLQSWVGRVTQQSTQSTYQMVEIRTCFF